MHKEVQSVGRPSPRNALKPQLNSSQLGTACTSLTPHASALSCLSSIMSQLHHVSNLLCLSPFMLAGPAPGLCSLHRRSAVPAPPLHQILSFSMSCGCDTSQALFSILGKICTYFVALNVCFPFPDPKISFFAVPIPELLSRNSFPR